jgi:hypothetical protein
MNDSVWVDCGEGVKIQLSTVEFPIKDWKGIMDKDGNEIPFSIENAKKLFKEYPHFADWLRFEMDWQFNIKKLGGNYE